MILLCGIRNVRLHDCEFLLLLPVDDRVCNVKGIIRKDYITFMIIFWPRRI